MKLEIISSVLWTHFLSLLFSLNNDYIFVFPLVVFLTLFFYRKTKEIRSPKFLTPISLSPKTLSFSFRAIELILLCSVISLFYHLHSYLDCLMLTRLNGNIVLHQQKKKNKKILEKPFWVWTLYRQCMLCSLSMSCLLSLHNFQMLAYHRLLGSN